MKTTFLLESLLGKISLLNQAVSSRAQLPALSGFLIEAEKGRLKISATDLEIGAIINISANTEEEGRAVVPAKPLSELLANTNEEKLTIEKTEDKAILVGKRLRATISVIDETDFPKIVDEKGKEIIRIKKEVFQNETGRVVFAAAQDSSRAAFSAVYFKQDKRGGTIVATDSHRLSKNTIAGEVHGDKQSPPALISARTIKAALAGKEGDEVVISVSDKNNQVVFSFGEDLVVGRMVDAEYPDFEKIIPTDSSSSAEFDTAEMQVALKSASVFARDNANIIKISIKKERISVFAKSPDLGENKIDVEAKTTGEENEIAFNGRYLMELLQNIQSERTVFEMTGPLNPGVFKIPNNNSFIHLIMPIRVKEEDLA